MSSVILYYPRLGPLAKAIHQLPIKARSLLIKQCQAQYDCPSVPPPSNLPRILSLLLSHPPVAFKTIQDTFVSVPLYQFLRYFEASVNDPVESAIILDLCRGLPVSPIDVEVTKRDGWLKEIRLAEENTRLAQINFRPFFQAIDDLIHPDIPYNLPALIRVRNCFRRFRDRLRSEASSRLRYPRATHKNMSKGTRRNFEEIFGERALSGIDIFGQDDWERVYHD